MVRVQVMFGCFDELLLPLHVCVTLPTAEKLCLWIPLFLYMQFPLHSLQHTLTVHPQGNDTLSHSHTHPHTHVLSVSRLHAGSLAG